MRVMEILGSMPAVTRYPYEQWADGKARLAERGVDFQGSNDRFIRTLHSWANRNGYGLVTRGTEKGVAFQFTKIEEAK